MAQTRTFYVNGKTYTVVGDEGMSNFKKYLADNSLGASEIHKFQTRDGKTYTVDGWAKQGFLKSNPDAVDVAEQESETRSRQAIRDRAVAGDTPRISENFRQDKAPALLNQPTERISTGAQTYEPPPAEEDYLEKNPRVKQAVQQRDKNVEQLQDLMFARPPDDQPEELERWETSVKRKREMAEWYSDEIIPKRVTGMSAWERERFRLYQEFGRELPVVGATLTALGLGGNWLATAPFRLFSVGGYQQRAQDAAMSGLATGLRERGKAYNDVQSAFFSLPMSILYYLNPALGTAMPQMAITADLYNDFYKDDQNLSQIEAITGALSGATQQLIESGIQESQFRALGLQFKKGGLPGLHKATVDMVRKSMMPTGKEIMISGLKVIGGEVIEENAQWLDDAIIQNVMLGKPMPTKEESLQAIRDNTVGAILGSTLMTGIFQGAQIQQARTNAAKMQALAENNWKSAALVTQGIEQFNAGNTEEARATRDKARETLLTEGKEETIAQGIANLTDAINAVDVQTVLNNKIIVEQTTEDIADLKKERAKLIEQVGEDESVTQRIQEIETEIEQKEADVAKAQEEMESNENRKEITRLIQKSMPTAMKMMDTINKELTKLRDSAEYKNATEEQQTQMVDTVMAQVKDEKRYQKLEAKDKANLQKVALTKLRQSKEYKAATPEVQQQMEQDEIAKLSERGAQIKQAAEKEVAGDKENTAGLPSSERVGEAVVQTQPDEGGGTEADGTGGNVQASKEKEVTEGQESTTGQKAQEQPQTEATEQTKPTAETRQKETTEETKRAAEAEKRAQIKKSDPATDKMAENVFKTIFRANIKTSEYNEDTRTHTFTFNDGKVVKLQHSTQQIAVYDQTGKQTGWAIGETKYGEPVKGNISVLVTLVDGANGGNRTLFHEAFHVAWKLCLTNDQRQYISDYYSSKASRGQMYEYKDGRRVKLSKDGWKKYSEQERVVAIEEWGADSAEQWLGLRADAPDKGLHRIWQSFFDRVRQLLIAYGHAPKGARISDIFHQMKTGTLESEGTATDKLTGQGTQSAETRNMLSNVYHGSGAFFDRFDVNFIGTGEGAQAFGWGIYVTEKQGVARDYAEKLRGKEFPTKIKIGGVPLAEYLEQNKLSRGLYEIRLQLAANEYKTDIFYGAKLMMAHEMNKLAENQDDAEIKRWVKVLELLHKVKDDITVGEGTVYRVNVWENLTEDVLEWDKPITQEQRDKIIDHINNVNPSRLGYLLDKIENPDNLKTGELVYRTIENVLGESDKAASEFLLRAGIDGIKYPVNALSGGKGEKGYNYVVFDADQINIKEHTRYKLAPTQTEIAEAERQMEAVRAEYQGTAEWMKAPNGKDTNLNERQWLQVRTPLFKAWFGDWENDPKNASKVVDENGEPLVIYHGTTHDFWDFNKTRGNIESDFGIAYYFTTTKDDAITNYAGEGADLTQRIELLAERLTDSDTDMERAREIARQELSGGLQRVVDAYIKIVNPVIIDEKSGYIESVPDMDYYKDIAKDEIDKDDYDYGDGVDEDDYQNALYEKATDIFYDDYNPKLQGGDFIRAFQRVASEYDTDNIYADYAGYLMSGIKASELIDKLKKDERIAYVEDENGDLASNEAIRLLFETAGFDGIIDKTVYNKFGAKSGRINYLQGMHSGTAHILAFSPAQIKSATANVGTFSESEDIRYKKVKPPVPISAAQVEVMSNWLSVMTGNTIDPATLVREVKRQSTRTARPKDIKKDIVQKFRAADREFGEEWSDTIKAARLTALSSPEYKYQNKPINQDDEVFHWDEAMDLAMSMGITQERLNEILESPDGYSGLMDVLLLKRMEGNYAEQIRVIETALRNDPLTETQRREMQKAKLIAEGKLIQITTATMFMVKDAARILNSQKMRKADRIRKMTDLYTAMAADLKSEHTEIKTLQNQIDEAGRKIDQLSDKHDKDSIRQVDELRRQIDAWQYDIDARLESLTPSEIQLDALQRMIDDMMVNPNQAARKSLKPMPLSLYDKAKIIWYNWILSGPPTHIVNISANVVNMALENMILGMINPISNPLALRSGVKALDVAGGLKAAGAEFKKPSEFSSKYQITATTDKFFNFVNTNCKLMSAEDAYFYFTNYKAHLMSLAIYESKRTGMTVRELYETPTRDMMIQAGYEAKKATFNHNPEGWIGNLINMMQKFYEEQEAHGELSGKIAAGTIRFTILPFTRIVANVANSTIDWTPFGLIRAARYYSTKADSMLNKQRNLWKNEDGSYRISPYRARDLSMQVARAATGTLMMSALLTAALKGIDGDDDDKMGFISGGGYLDYEMNRQLEMLGWKPYSIRIPGTDRWIPYIDTPFATAFAFVGNVHDYHAFNKSIKPEEAWDAWSYGLLGTAKSFTDKQFLSGLNNVMNAVTMRNEKWLRKTLAAFVTIPVNSNLLRFAEKTFYDQNVYAPETLAQAIMVNTPFSPKGNVPKALNVYGNEVQQPPPLHRFIGSPARKGDEWEVTNRMGRDFDMHRLSEKLLRKGVKIPTSKGTELKIREGRTPQFISIRGKDLEKFRGIRGNELGLLMMKNQRKLERLADKGQISDLKKLLRSISTQANNQAKKEMIKDYRRDKLQHKYEIYDKSENQEET